MAANQKSRSGRLGIDYDERVAGTGTSNDEGNDFPLGTLDHAEDGTVWMYVHASGAITAFDAVGIDENYEAASLTKAHVDDGWQIGFAQAAFSDNDFGWVALRGSNIKCLLSKKCAPDVALYTTGIAGILDDTSASQTKVDGVVAVASSTSTGTATGVEVIATWPRSTTF